MKKLESIKKDTFKAFEDYQINNLAACTGGEVMKTYHGGCNNYSVNTCSDNGWTMGGKAVDYSVWQCPCK